MKKLQMSQCGLSLSYTHTRAHTFLWQATFFKGNCIDAPHVNTQKRGFFFEFWVQTMPLPSPHLQGLVWAPVASLLSYPELIHESFIILLCITILVIRIGIESQDEGEGEIWKTINLITGFWPGVGGGFPPLFSTALSSQSRNTQGQGQLSLLQGRAAIWKMIRAVPNSGDRSRMRAIKQTNKRAEHSKNNGVGCFWKRP